MRLIVLTLLALLTARPAIADEYLVIQPNTHVDSPLPNQQYEYDLNAEYDGVQEYVPQEPRNLNEWQITDNSIIRIEVVPYFDLNKEELSYGKLMVRLINK